MDFNSDYNFSVPDSWYNTLYIDKRPCCSAARSFSLVHSDSEVKECWLLVHGYRGYPGELIHPAEDLYMAGFDVYVPRLPGHGTSCEDFIHSSSRDWVGLVKNAVEDLKTRYSKVNLLGHSMSSATIALVGAKDKSVDKIVYACPSFENLLMPLGVRIKLFLMSPFKKTIKCNWRPNHSYNLHYQNAPCDDNFLGHEYWQFYFTKQLCQYYRLMKRGLRALGNYPHKNLVLYPKKDRYISAPSVELYKKALKPEFQNIISIENGSHFIFYDADPTSEALSVSSVVNFALE